METDCHEGAVLHSAVGNESIKFEKHKESFETKPQQVPSPHPYQPLEYHEQLDAIQ